MRKAISAMLAIMLIICVLPAASVQASDKQELLNGATLKPMRTNYPPLDARVDEIFAQILTDEMDTYEKVKACYTYLIEDSVYYQHTKWYNELYTIRDTYGYVSINDVWLIYEASFFLEEKYGVCDDYAAAFTVMTRALGLEAYYVWGQTNTVGGGYAGHAWVNIRIGDAFYHFDPQVEANIAKRNDGVISYSRFCSTDAEMEGRLIIENRDGCVAAFGGFACKGAAELEVSGTRSGVSLPALGNMSFDIDNIGNFAENSVVELRYAEGETPYVDGLNVPCYGYSYENGVITWEIDLVGEYTLYVTVTEPDGRVSVAAFTYIFFDWSDSGIVGDMNGDGRVNAQDASLVLRLDVQLLIPTEWQCTAGDFNADGKLNAQDAAGILQYDVGKLPMVSN